MVYPERCADHHDNQTMNTTDFGDTLTFTLGSPWSWHISRLFQIGVDHPSAISTSHPRGVWAGWCQISSTRPDQMLSYHLRCNKSLYFYSNGLAGFLCSGIESESATNLTPAFEFWIFCEATVFFVWPGWSVLFTVAQSCFSSEAQVIIFPSIFQSSSGQQGIGCTHRGLRDLIEMK